MADEYLPRAVAKAVAQASGDRKAAARLLLRRAAADERLLKALVGPYMPGIVAQAVQRHGTTAGRTGAGAGAGTEPGPVRGRALGSADLDVVIGRLGQDIGTAAVHDGPAALLGREPRPKAGPGHEQALRTIAKAFARKRLEGEAV